MSLNPETLYIVWNYDEVSYARTPDGEGCYWYDEGQKEDAYDDVCRVTNTMTFTSQREFDNYRYGYYI